MQIGATSLAMWLFLLSPPAFAQEPASEEEPAFLTGTWVTDEANVIAPLSAGLPASVPEVPIRIYSTYLADGFEVGVTVRTDRGDSPATVAESSGAVVEGRNIELIQRGKGKISSGGWKALRQSIGVDQFTTLSWGANPSRNTQILDLIEPRQFVLTFGGHPSPSCNNGRLSIRVDGQWLKYRAGTTVQLLPGSSVWSYGKSVYVLWSGTCTIPTPAPPGATPLARGSLKVAH